MKKELSQTFIQETITPENAKKMLAFNKVNRPISEKTSKAYAEDMKNGRWDTNTTSCIAFDTKGNLVDGQHRLTAVIIAGVPVKMWVSRNVGDHVVFDSGRNRTLSDFMKINHFDMDPRYHNNKVVALMKCIIAYNKNHTPFSRVTPRELEQFVFNHSEDFDTFFSVVSLSGVSKISVTTVYLGMFTAYKGGVSLEDISHYYSVLSSGLAESERDYPIIAYRDYLVRKDHTSKPSAEEIKICQGSIKKYLTKSNFKRIWQPKDFIWEFPYKEEY